jgi:hypothetical protein
MLVHHGYAQILRRYGPPYSLYVRQNLSSLLWILDGYKGLSSKKRFLFENKKSSLHHDRTLSISLKAVKNLLRGFCPFLNPLVAVRI